MTTFDVGICEDHPHCFLSGGHEELTFSEEYITDRRDQLIADIERLIISLEELEAAEECGPHKYSKVHILLRHTRNEFQRTAK